METKPRHTPASLTEAEKASIRQRAREANDLYDRSSANRMPRRSAGNSEKSGD